MNNKIKYTIGLLSIIAVVSLISILASPLARATTQNFIGNIMSIFYDNGNTEVHNSTGIYLSGTSEVILNSKNQNELLRLNGTSIIQKMGTNIITTPSDQMFYSANNVDGFNNLRIITNISTHGVGIYGDNFGNQDMWASFQWGVLNPTEYHMKIQSLNNQTNSVMIHISNLESLTDSTYGFLDMNYLAGSGNVQQISNYGNGSALFIGQYGNYTKSVNGGAVYIDNTNNINRAFSVYSNAPYSTTGIGLVKIFQDNTANTEGLLNLQNDGSGEALYIKGGNITGTSTGLVYITTNTKATSPAVRMDLVGNSTGIYIVAQSTDKLGKGIDLNLDGNNTGIKIDSEGSESPLLIMGNATAMNCNSINEGGIYYDATVNKHYGCDGTNWNAFY